MLPERLQSIIRCGTILAATILTACVSNIHAPYVDRDEMPPPAGSEIRSSHDTLFSYPGTPLAVDNHDAQAGSHEYQLKRIAFPAPYDNGQQDQLVRIRYYRHDSEIPKPLVIVVPIYGSYTYPSEKITAGLLRLHPELNVALLEYDDYLFDFEKLASSASEADAIESMNEIRERVRAGVVDVRRVIDWAERQSDIDSDRIAVITFSASALIGSLLAQHEPRLSAGVIVMGTAIYHDILSVCAGRPGMAREAVLERFGWSVDHYRGLLKEALGVVDPARYPGLADPSRLLMIDAHHDDCMPQHARDALWVALGKPERISYRYTHKRSFLAMTPLGFNVMRRRIYDFVESQVYPQG